MRFRNEVSQLLPRKVVSASITASVFAVLLGLFDSAPFGGTLESVGDYFQGVIPAVYVYLLYGFPAILVYATITSTLSDHIAGMISNKRLKIYVSIVLHILFGLVLLWYSLLASILYFTIDYILSKKYSYDWISALKSLGIPIVVWIICIAGIYIMEIFG